MRVLHVIPSVAARYGGPSAAIGPMCRALIDAGADTWIATTDADGPSHLPVPLGEPTTWDGVPALFFRKDATESFKYSRGLAQWLDGHVRDFNVVHVHAVLSHAPLAAAAACRRAGVPYVVRPLGTLASWSLGRKAWRKKLLLTLAAGRMLRGAASIHCTSEEERADLERAFGLTQGFVIPLGIDAKRLAASPEDFASRAADRYVLALSRLHPKKNFELLIDAFADAREQTGSGWRLVIAGSGDDEYARLLRGRVTARGAEAYVSFAGWVEGDAKRTLIQRASLFALPSRHENFGIAVLEALAAGVPAVISRDVQLGAAVDAHAAGWVVDGTRTAVAAALTTAITNDTEREQRGRAALSLAADYAWPAVARRLIVAYGTNRQ